MLIYQLVPPFFYNFLGPQSTGLAPTETGFQEVPTVRQAKVHLFDTLALTTDPLYLSHEHPFHNAHQKSSICLR